jgi:two-component system alkaline phosphatase synthesis response regulator PhoP
MNSDVKASEDTLLIGKHEINFKTFRLINTTSGEELALSKKEIGLIKLFSSKEGEVISRNEILDVVWGKDQFPTTRTIDNFILNFRKIFEEDPRSPKYFHSVRGVGYRFTL